MDTWRLAPRATGADSAPALNVQPTNDRIPTERVEFNAAFGGTLALAVQQQ